MTESASPGIGLAFAVQTAKGVPVTNGPSFKKVRVLDSNLGNQQQMGRFPIEVGGNYHPGGAFKIANVGMGTVRWHPRLAGDIGYLLYALFGGVQASGASAAGGAYTTRFLPLNDHCGHPWLTARKLTPNCTTAGYKGGDELTDSKLASMSFQLGAGAPAVSQMAFLSINAATPSGASDWETAMTDTYENTDSVVLAPSSLKPVLKAVTGIDLGGGVNTDFSVPTLGFELNIANQFSGSNIRDELVVGAYGLDDLVLVGQAISFRIVYKWKDPLLYRAVYNYSSQFTWSPTTLAPAVEFPLKAPSLAGSSTTHEQLTVHMAQVPLDCPRGLVLSGGQFLTIEITGVAQAQSTPAAYAYADLVNGHAYTDLGVTYNS